MSEKNAYDIHRQYAFMACALWPVAVVIFFPGLVENLWLGTILLILSIAQFLWVPDAWAEWMTREK